MPTSQFADLPVHKRLGLPCRRRNDLDQRSNAERLAAPFGPLDNASKVDAGKNVPTPTRALCPLGSIADIGRLKSLIHEWPQTDTADWSSNVRFAMSFVFRITPKSPLPLKRLRSGRSGSASQIID